MTQQPEIDRSWNKRFEDHTEFMVSNPVYDGLFYERDKNGRVKWVVYGKSEKGKIRRAWWDKQCERLGIPIRKGCYAIVSRMLHPTKKHVCQCCGKELSIFYEYPGKRLIELINKAFGWNLTPSDKTVKEIIQDAAAIPDGLKTIQKILHIDTALSLEQTIRFCYNEMVAKENNLLSPGVMSNCPDRFDGFHSDGLCCRSETDKGRHSDNMKTYAQDRRAYEEWSDGNWNLANRIMGEYAKQKACQCPQCGKIRKMTADHIGPVSLGFCHSKYFQPLCRSCNSAKNNRFTFADVRTLLDLERSGETVISWHSRPVWDMVKFLIGSDDDAKSAGNLMAHTHQNILKLLSIVYRESGTGFLSRYLHPEFAEIDYRFKNFDFFDFSDEQIVQKRLTSANKIKNKERYVRIAFESLAEFDMKDNRKVHFYLDEFADEISILCQTVRDGDYPAADSLLQSLIDKISLRIFNAEWQRQ